MKIPTTAPRYLPRWLRHGILSILDRTVFVLDRINPRSQVKEWMTDLYIRAWIALGDRGEVIP